MEQRGDEHCEMMDGTGMQVYINDGGKREVTQFYTSGRPFTAQCIFNGGLI